MSEPFLICGGDMTPGKRDECPNALHDYPLPNGYNDAHETASRRLARHWHSRKCPECGFYGWIPGKPLNDGSDGPVKLA